MRIVRLGRIVAQPSIMAANEPGHLVAAFPVDQHASRPSRLRAQHLRQPLHPFGGGLAAASCGDHGLAGRRKRLRQKIGIRPIGRSGRHRITERHDAHGTIGAVQRATAED
jgi:hypothetical protein